ncbi:protein jagged-1-like [Haliotis asinina]|uniref:protein jagged-1-like n=1 Tax=Haliotis asinina TaxID=109174 RepID=UPI00353192A7
MFYLHCCTVVVVVVVVMQVCSGSGVFELGILSVNNPRGELASGVCCSGGRGREGVCSTPCKTQFRACLKEYQSRVTPDGTCTFGNVSSLVHHGNSFTLPEGTGNTLELPFNFAWTRSYTLIVEAWNVERDNGASLIERASHKGIILPGQAWHTITHNGATARLTFRIRVVCDTHYYNTTCTKFCRPHNDLFGHYKCDSNGDKNCMTGWMGQECETAICIPGCHAVHGSCERPGECRCAYGWQGDLCDQCIPYPGCKHGSCNGSPWQCVCHLNWGGILCNKDLNFCGRHHPCRNGGLCRNINPDEYACTCPKGFSGRNCEIADHACTSSPCVNGGKCVEIHTGFVCNCPPGWTGTKCDINVNECESNPCLHNGTCVDQDNSYDCECPEGWQGPHCQLDADECSGSPCVNAYACHNLVGGYTCDCQPGWTGKRCDQNVDDCAAVQCFNGASCVDLVNGHYCACIPGYTGARCQIEINECASNPCQNGATCRNQLAAYSCDCHDGYTGVNCEIDMDPCNPNPCKHGSSCFNIQGDFYCHCRDGFDGKDCSQMRSTCAEQSCEVIDSCTISIPSNESVGGFRLISSSVCGHHGICISQPSGRFSCACETGYTGTYCHENIDDCASNPCQNNGTCIDGVNSYQCICMDGWEGALCNINRNDCETNPCRNGGSCVDDFGQFVCQCVNGWKGKTCTLTDSHCDDTTCSNGGSCADVGNTFACDCQEGWVGNTCQRPAVYSCDSSPCRHGGTCVNSGDSFTCICRDGYEGQMCEKNINDCNPFPCYNGGTCIDDVNWYVCRCAKGFSGPDCRVNINECASSPCTYGSTCIDGIGEFTCICPPGRTGDRCQTVIGQIASPNSCVHDRRIYEDGSQWEHQCNSCICDNGKVTCSKIWCGPRNCLPHPNTSEPVVHCMNDETCVVQTKEICFTPPCLPWGQCKKVDHIKDPMPQGLETACTPNSANLGNNCAKITLVFDKSKMPMGVSVETICNTLRQLPVLRKLANHDALFIMCGIKEGQVDTVEVTLSTNVASGEMDPLIHTAIDRVTDVVSHKQSNSSALSAVREIRVERTIVDRGTRPSYLIPLVCSIMGIIGVTSIIILVIWHHRRQRARRQRLESYTNYQKTNNENEQNIRRYRNPLFGTDKGGGTSKNISATELRDIDLEKYEKSPRRDPTQTDSSTDFNDFREHTPPPKTSHKKDINIEIDISRTLASDREVIV